LFGKQRLREDIREKFFFEREERSFFFLANKELEIIACLPRIDDKVIIAFVYDFCVLSFSHYFFK